MKYLRLHGRKGFSITEIVIIVTVLAVLAAIVIVAYHGVQRRTADAQTRTTVSDALKNLQLHYAFSRAYPANMADTEYAPPLSVAVSLHTNSPLTPVYEGLTTEQNAQLFLNACNGFMPIVSGGTTYNTACVFDGNNAHIKGSVSSNVVIGGPDIALSDFTLSCGPVCDAARNDILAQFQAQGGTFPLKVPKSGSTLPAPTSVSYGPASRFCVEGRSGAYTDIVYHATDQTQAIEGGPCPSDPELHYP